MNGQNSGRMLADHETVFTHPRCSTRRMSIAQDIQARQYHTARKRLKRLYADCFGIDNADWTFMDALARVRSAMTNSTVLTFGDGERKDCIFTSLLKGHGPIRDLYGANIETLCKAGLLRLPRICREKRARLIYKPYYVLTPEATDCIDTSTVGFNVGDLGETVVHAVGARLYGEYMKSYVPQETGLNVSVQYYDDAILDDHAINVAVLVYPPGESHNRRLYAVGEVKTVLGSDSEAIDTLYKLGTVDCEHKHWIAPKRELINKIVNVAALRGWYTMARVPETLALETTSESGIQSTNDRVAESEYTTKGLGLPMSTPLTKGFSYAMLYRELKEADPTTFDTPPVTKARL